MKIVVAFILILLSHLSFAQTMPDFDLVKMDNTADFKTAEPFVLQTCNFLLSTPVVKGNDNRLKSMQFIYKWMSGTNDFSFTFEDDVSKMIKDNPDLVGLFMAGMAKYALENRATMPDVKKIKLNAVTALLSYCENSHNKIKITKQVKKLLEARDAGKLQEML